MAKIAVVYWSGTGNTEAMANLVAEGARIDGNQVDVLNVSDTDVDTVLGYDKIAFGCPAMGDESLEEVEFEPFYTDIKGRLCGRPVVLFGSYSWAEGAWMETWQEDARSNGLNLVADGLICFEAPEGDTEDACRKLGETLAKVK